MADCQPSTGTALSGGKMRPDPQLRREIDNSDLPIIVFGIVAILYVAVSR
jgi:hypothetical protein